MSGAPRPTSQVARFLGVGVVNTAIDLGLYAVLHGAGLPVVVANLLSTSAGLVFSYVANSTFTFRVDRFSLRALVLFLLTTGVALWVLQPVVIVLATGALAAGAPAAPTPVVLLAPKVVAIGVGVLWNFAWYSRLVFRPRDRSAARPVAPAPEEVGSRA